MTAVSRLRSLGSALLVVLVGLGAVGLWGAGVLAQQAGRGGSGAGSVAVLAAGALLVGAAVRPDRWAPWLSRAGGGPAARVRLVLGLALGGPALALLSFARFFVGADGAEAGALPGWLLAPVAVGSLPVFVAVLRSEGAPRRASLVLPLAGLVALVGVSLSLVETLLGPAHATPEAARRAFVDSFGPARVLDLPASEGAAGQGPGPDDGADPSGLDTMVERHVRGAGERPVERRLDISRAEQQMTLGLSCPTPARCEAAVSSVGGLRPRFVAPLDPRSPVLLRQGGPDGQMLLSNAGRDHVIDAATGEGHRVTMRDLRPWLRLPRVWRLAPLALAPVLAGLWWWRRRAHAWRQALAGGTPGRVSGGWLRGPGGLDAPTSLRDGHAVVLPGADTAAGYRAMAVLAAGAVVAGRQRALVERAALNVRVVDATALLLASLAAAPLVAARLALLHLSAREGRAPLPPVRCTGGPRVTGAERE